MNSGEKGLRVGLAVGVSGQRLDDNAIRHADVAESEFDMAFDIRRGHVSTLTELNAEHRALTPFVVDSADGKAVNDTRQLASCIFDCRERNLDSAGNDYSVTAAGNDQAFASSVLGATARQNEFSRIIRSEPALTVTFDETSGGQFGVCRCVGVFETVSEGSSAYPNLSGDNSNVDAFERDTVVYSPAARLG